MTGSWPGLNRGRGTTPGGLIAPRTPSIYNPRGITSANTFVGGNTGATASAPINLSPYSVNTRIEGDNLVTTKTRRVLGGPDVTSIIYSTSISAALAQSAATQVTTQAVAYVPESLAGPLQTLAIGDPIQQVWARRREGGTGGTMVHCKATEISLTNNATTITAAFHCVISAGQIGPIRVGDVRQGTVRQGLVTAQNYNKRAGTSVPGNFTNQATATGFTLPTLPTVCGGGGDYAELSTMEFVRTYPGESQDIFLTITVFVRAGIIVTRLEDGVTGPTDNPVDVILWNALRTKRLRPGVIDMDQMEIAAKFCAANKLYFNGVLPGGDNLEDLLTNMLPAFLLRTTSVNGRFALAPVLPYNADYTINYGALDPDFVLTEAAIAPGSYRVTYATPEARISPIITVTWRQQTSEVEPPLMRTLDVGALASDDPPEQWDVAGVVAYELHAATAGGYRHGQRTLSEGVGTVAIRHGSYSGLLREGMLVQILLNVVTLQEPPELIRKWWVITGRTLTPDGTEVFQLEHFPVDAEGRSLVAQAVAQARQNAPGAILPYPTISTGDVAGRAADASTPAATTSGVPFSAGGSGIVGTGGFVASGGGGGASGGGGGFDQAVIYQQPPDNPPVKEEAPAPVVGQLDAVPPATGQPVKPRYWLYDNWAYTFSLEPVGPVEVPEECPDGFYDLSYLIYNESHGTLTVLNKDGSQTAFADPGINIPTATLVEPPHVEEVESREIISGPYIGQQLKTIKIYLSHWNEEGDDDVEIITGFTGPLPLDITRLNYRCALPNGDPDELVVIP